MRLPTSLNAYERKQTHALAEKLGLGHESRGRRGIDRQICIWRITTDQGPEEQPASLVPKVVGHPPGAARGPSVRARMGQGTKRNKAVRLVGPSPAGQPLQETATRLCGQPPLRLAVESDTESRPKSRKVAFLVLDFEATCSGGKGAMRAPEPQEIIEWPAVALAADGSVVAEVQIYIRPVHHPQLHPFCVELTGICQDWTDGVAVPEGALWASDFVSGAALFERWLSELDLGELEAVVTCGDWDLRSMLPRQLAVSEVTLGGLSQCLGAWCNIKELYRQCYGVKAHGIDMMEMLEGLSLTHAGRHHSGIDDCRNTAQLVQRMLRHGHRPRNTQRLG